MSPDRNTVTSLAYIRGVAVEQVVGHTEEELLQFGPKKWGGRKVVLGWGLVQRLAAPLNDGGRNLTADLQVELLHFLHVAFGRSFFTEVT